jgi:hypothetical protein
MQAASGIVVGVQWTNAWVPVPFIGDLHEDGTGQKQHDHPRALRRGMAERVREELMSKKFDVRGHV